MLALPRDSRSQCRERLTAVVGNGWPHLPHALAIIANADGGVM